MSPAKRIFDLALALVLVALLWPVFVLAVLIILLTDGRPIFYVSERMMTSTRPFTLWKFRTMQTGTEDGGVSGGNKKARVTAIGRWLRRYRLDELPQLWNILCGEMSFVGPRPPLRRYVEKFPDLYAKVLQARPGLTGLATLVYHRREEALLADCSTAEQTEDIYSRICVPAKARLDIMYLKKRSVCYDIALLWQTARRVVGKSR